MTSRTRSHSRSNGTLRGFFWQLSLISINRASTLRDIFSLIFRFLEGLQAILTSSSDKTGAQFFKFFRPAIFQFFRRFWNSSTTININTGAARYDDLCRVALVGASNWCSGDDEEHKLVLRGDISFIKQETFLTKAFDSSKGTTLTGLPTFDSFSDLDSENEFVTDLTRFSENFESFSNKRQCLDLISFDEEDILSEDSFDDFEDLASSGLLTPLESRCCSEDAAMLVSKPLKKRSQVKKAVATKTQPCQSRSLSGSAAKQVSPLLRRRSHAGLEVLKPLKKRSQVKKAVKNEETADASEPDAKMISFRPWFRE